MPAHTPEDIARGLAPLENGGQAEQRAWQLIGQRLLGLTEDMELLQYDEHKKALQELIDDFKAIAAAFVPEHRVVFDGTNDEEIAERKAVQAKRLYDMAKSPAVSARDKSLPRIDASTLAFAEESKRYRPMKVNDVEWEIIYRCASSIDQISGKVKRDEECVVTKRWLRSIALDFKAIALGCGVRLVGASVPDAPLMHGYRGERPWED